MLKSTRPVPAFANNVSFVITCLAGAVALMVALILPAGYYAVEREALTAELQTEAEVRSAALARSFIANGGSWPAQHDMEMLLSQTPQLNQTIQANSLVGTDGELLQRSGAGDPARPVTVHTMPVSAQRHRVGELRLERSIRPLYEGTALAALLGAALGGAAFLAFRVLPLRALKRAMEALHTEVSEHAEARRQAESANRAKSMFLAAASHDLRQPLHALSMFAGVLAEKEDRPATRDLVMSINACVDALENLFSAIMDISRLDAGVMEPKLAVFPIASVLDRLRTEFAEPARTKGVELIVQPCADMVLSDQALLQRILNNLVANAVRYTDAGQVIVECRRGASALRIEVRDSGAGIDAAELPRIFDEFYQVGNPERDRTKGLGLGLAIVRRLGTLLAHPIDVQSTPGKGSSFSIEVPFQPDAAPAHAPAARPASGPLKAKVLVVIDDEPAVREGMGMLLRHWGCDPVVSASLEEARDELQRRGIRPDGVIADYRLRAGVGTEAIVALRERYGRDLPAAVITGDIGPDRLAEFAANGFRHLHKPVPPAKLREFLDSLFVPA